MSSRTLVLIGQHPYQREARAELPVPVLDAVPYTEESGRDLPRSIANASQAQGWIALAGPYTKADEAALLSLLWDLTGRPFTIGGNPRRRATIAVVRQDGGIVVYRAASECLDGEAAYKLNRKDAAA